MKKRQQQSVGPGDICRLKMCSPHTFHVLLLATYNQIGSRTDWELMTTAPLLRKFNTRALMRVLRLSYKHDQISVILTYILINVVQNTFIFHVLQLELWDVIENISLK